MKIKNLRDDLEKYLKKYNLEKKYIKTGKSELMSFDDFEKRTNKLELKYDNTNT